MPHDGTGTGWDTTAPANSDAERDGAKEIRDLRIGVGIRSNKEHVAAASSSAGGEHKAGSAVAYVGTSDPTLRPDGSTALTAADYGRIFYSSSSGAVKVYTSGGWVQINATSTAVKAAVIQDLKSSGTDGGSFTSGSWTQRTLTNTVSDPSSIVSALSSNRFTLAAGTYLFHAVCPANAVDKHQCRLVVDPAGTPAYYYGTTAYAISSVTNVNYSIVEIVITLTGSTVLELQHRCQTSKSTSGFGIASSSSFGNLEVYSTISILKIA